MTPAVPPHRRKPSPPEPLRYRSDIDGLRAVAVLPVIFFHLGAGPFAGGFVGVDVFFVVSGYLITSILLDEIGAGSFTYLGFYERRIRRIFPALFVMMGVSLPLALLVLVPEHLEDFGQSVIAAALFVSNVFFFLEDGYFEGPADLHPLLHTWSLAVEEQFYLFMPLVLVLVVRRGVSVPGCLAALAAASLLFSIWQLGSHPSAAFYLLPARLWELMLGAWLATTAVSPVRSMALAAVGVLAGLCAIGVAVFVFHERTPFPGPAALLPCIGAALVIHFGRTANPVSDLLGSSPLRRVGLLSYSLYLWHFPLAVFARHLIVRPFTALEIVVLLAVTFILSVLSWRYVEQPFRIRPRRVERRLLYRLAGVVMACSVAFGLFTDFSDGAPERFGASARVLLATSENRDTRCLRQGRNCEIGDPDAPARFIVWGDSHAGAMLAAFRTLAERHDVSGRAMLRGGCIPAIGYFTTTAAIAQACYQANQAALAAALEPDVHTVFLAGRWTLLVEESLYGFEGGRAHGLVDESGALRDAPTRMVLEKVLDATLAELRGSGRQVYLIGPVPEVGWHVPHTLAQRERFAGLLADEAITPTREAFDARNRQTLALLETLARHHGAQVLYPHRMLCGEDACALMENGRLLYYDTNHLTITGALLLTPMLEPAFREMSR